MTDSRPGAEWMLRNDAAELLDVNIAAFKELVASGRLFKGAAFTRDGRYRRVDVEALRVKLEQLSESEGISTAAAAALLCRADGGIERSTEHYLYLLEIYDVGCKVGITHQPSKRLHDHAAMASCYARSTGRVLLTWPHEQARVNELALTGEGPNEYLREPFDVLRPRVLARVMTRSAGTVAPPPVLYSSVAALRDAFCARPDLPVPPPRRRSRELAS